MINRDMINKDTPGRKIARLLPLLAAAATAVSLTGAPAAVASPGGTVLRVAADGSAPYRTVQAAVDAVPQKSSASATIVIAAGTYTGTVEVPSTKPGINFLGATGDPRDVVITEHHSAGTSTPDGGTYGTEGSATMTIEADNTIVDDISIVNAYDPVLHANDPGGQAVALRTVGDRIILDNDRVLGRQDTLYLDTASPSTRGRVYVRDSYVAGTVDFIFGRATGVFDHSTIDALDNGSTTSNGYITAASTALANPYGFLFTDSRFVSDAPAKTYYLGRPWHHTGDDQPFAQVLIRDSWLGAHIKDHPWTDMSGWSWTSARFDEYNNTGPGAGVNPYRPQLTDQQARDYTRADYLAGGDHWKPWTYRVPTPPSGAQTICRPETYGAAGDGTTDDTAAIQRALTTCADGGRVSLSGGRYLTGPLEVPGNETVELVNGATLLATTNSAAYPQQGSHLTPLITVQNASHVTVTGAGTIDGQGQGWWDVIRTEKEKGEPLSPRPALVALTASSDIRVDTLTLLNAPNTNVSLHDVTTASFVGITISAPADSPNTDGINAFSSSDLLITGCSISNGDDNVVVNSSDGAPTSNVKVTENRFGSGHGLSIGSYTSGGIHDVHFTDNSLVGTTTGARIKTARDRGGEITDVSYEHLMMRDVPTPIAITAYYPKVPADGDKAVPVTNTTPNIHGVSLSDITATGADEAGQLIGLPEQPLTDISLTRVDISADTGLVVRNATVNADSATKITTGSGRDVILQSNATYLVDGVPIQPPKPVALADTFNNIGTGTAESPGNLDGSGRYFTRDSLAASGLTPGATITHGNFTFTWPDAAVGNNDNVVPSGEAVAITGSGSQLGILGVGTHGNQSGTVTVTYADGSTSTGPVGFTDWWDTTPSQDDELVASATSSDGHTVGIFAAAVPLDAGKTVTSVKLPDNSNMHIFAVSIA